MQVSHVMGGGLPVLIKEQRCHAFCKICHTGFSDFLCLVKLLGENVITLSNPGLLGEDCVYDPPLTPISTSLRTFLIFIRHLALSVELVESLVRYIQTLKGALYISV